MPPTPPVWAAPEGPTGRRIPPPISMICEASISEGTVMRIITARGGEDDFFFWNVSANVGVNSPNKPEDVQLVQFGYFAMSVLNIFEQPEELRRIFAAVKL